MSDLIRRAEAIRSVIERQPLDYQSLPGMAESVISCCHDLINEGDDQAEIIEWYFFNTARSRKVVDELQGGAMVPVRLLNVEDEQVEEERGVTVPAGAYTSKGTEATRNIQVQIERPNILYYMNKISDYSHH